MRSGVKELLCPGQVGDGPNLNGRPRPPLWHTNLENRKTNKPVRLGSPPLPGPGLILLPPPSLAVCLGFLIWEGQAKPIHSPSPASCWTSRRGSPGLGSLHTSAWSKVQKGNVAPTPRGVAELPGRKGTKLTCPHPVPCPSTLSQQMPGRKGCSLNTAQFRSLRTPSVSVAPHLDQEPDTQKAATCLASWVWGFCGEGSHLPFLTKSGPPFLTKDSSS